MSIRLRLTLFYTAILAFTLIAFSSILYVSQTRATYASIKTNLAGQVTGFVRAIEHAPGPPPGQAETAPAPSSLPLGKPIVMDLSSSTLPGRWTQTRSIAGTVMGQTPDLSGMTLPLSTKGLEAVQSGSDWYETAQVDNEPLLIYSLPHTTQTGVTVIVQVAFPIAQPQQSLNALRLVLIVGSSLAILAAFALGWVLAGTALRPIQRITQTAQAIGAERNFGRRVEHKGPADEVGQLAVTFNVMLAELESGYRQLEDALYSQRRFVADASHELRTPLTTVRGNIELLRREPPIAAGERADIVADTTEEVDRLIRLVNELLVLARADAGQTLRADPIPVQALVEDVCRQSKLLTPNTRIQCEAPADVLVQGDRDALKQVLLILVDNALVHTPAGTPVTLTASAADARIVFSVCDSGPGIAPEALPHIFERFYRGQASRTGRGAGLGLSIAKELVEAQGGTITVESQLGRGSTFTITLPSAPSDQPALS
jgi:two-component system, OmpR family, sensor kinase